MKSLVLAAVLGPALVVGAGAAATPGTGVTHAVVTGGATGRSLVATDPSDVSAVGGPASGASADPTACDGVAVVVDGGALDTSALGSASVLACALVDGPSSAHDAVTASGIELQGTEQWGAAFVCRVDGRPALDEDVRRADGSVGVESCVRTPSQGAHWALWTSTDGSTWVYATRGATSLEVAPGDAVGLVFVTSDQPGPPQVGPADALAGIAPGGWPVSTGLPGAPASSPSAEGQTAEGPQGSAGDAPASASGPVDGSVGVVALVGLVLAGGLLCFAALRVRARRP